MFRNIIIKQLFKWIYFKIYIITYTNKYLFIKKNKNKQPRGRADQTLVIIIFQVHIQ